jgi:hypothetical protein
LKDLALFYLLRVGVLLLIAVSAYAAGRRLLGRLDFSSVLEEGAFSVALGLGAISNAALLLGLLGLLSRGGVVALLLAANLFGSRAWRSAFERMRSWLRRNDSRRRGWAAAGLFAALAILLPLLEQASFPPKDFDAIMYHLPVAKAYAAAHRVEPLPHLRYPVFPQASELLFAAAILLADDVTAQMVVFLFFVVVLGGLLAWSLRSRKLPVGVWGAALWIGSPSVLLLSGNAYVEMALAAFGTLSLYALLVWWETDRRGWATAAGALAGCAAATKYTGLFFVAVVAGGLLRSLARRGGARDAVLPLLGAVAFGGPWYLRNALLAGDPVWPFLGRLLGYRFWTAGDLNSMMHSMRSYGWGRGIENLIQLPWNLATERSGWAGSLRIVFLLLPLTLAVAAVGKTGRRVGLVVAAYMLFWFYTNQLLRFLVPISPVICALTAGAAWATARTLGKHLLSGAKARAAFAALGFAALALPGVFWMVRERRASGPPPVTAAAREDFLSSRFPSYRFYRELNRRFGRDYVVYAFHDEDMKYYCEGMQLGDWFGPARYASIPLSSGRALFESLRKFDADYLLMHSRGPMRLPADSSFSELFEPVYRQGPVSAYRLLGAPVAAVRSAAFLASAPRGP